MGLIDTRQPLQPGAVFLREAPAAIVRRFVWAKAAPPPRLEGYMCGVSASELVFMVEKAPEGGYVARGLGEPIFIDADDLAALRAMVADAVACYFDEADRPKVVRLHIVRDELLAV